MAGSEAATVSFARVEMMSINGSNTLLNDHGCHFVTAPELPPINSPGQILQAQSHQV
jgi:hypothetical protein